MTDKHLIRLSIDIVAIKNNRFYGKVYVQCQENQFFGIRQFNTSPNLELSYVHSSDFNIKNGFVSFEKSLDQNELFSFLENNELEFNIYHNQSNKDDQLIGKVFIPLEKIKELKFKKTEESYIRILDKYYIIQDIENDSGFKIGELRVKIFLEDLGPIDGQINQFDEKIIIQQQEKIEINDHVQNEELDLEEIQMKVIQELDLWKKTEEQKFYLELKRKELEMLNQMQQDVQKKENEREKSFLQYEQRLQKYDQQLRNKAVQLQKRENEIKLFESKQEFKINEFVQKEIEQRQRIENLNEKFENKISDLKNKIKILEKNNKQKDNEISSHLNEIKSLKKLLEDSPIKQSEKTIEELQNQINDLQKNISSYKLLKKEYEQIFQGLQQQINQSKLENNNLKELLQTQNFQKQNDYQIENYSQKFNDLRKDLKIIQKDSKENDSQLNYSNNNSQISKLIQEKEFLLSLGMEKNDIMINELDKEIINIKNTNNQFKDKIYYQNLYNGNYQE